MLALQNIRSERLATDVRKSETTRCNRSASRTVSCCRASSKACCENFDHQSVRIPSQTPWLMCNTTGCIGSTKLQPSGVTLISFLLTTPLSTTVTRKMHDSVLPFNYSSERGLKRFHVSKDGDLLRCRGMFISFFSRTHCERERSSTRIFLRGLRASRR